MDDTRSVKDTDTDSVRNETSIRVTRSRQSIKYVLERQSLTRTDVWGPDTQRPWRRVTGPIPYRRRRGSQWSPLHNNKMSRVPRPDPRGASLPSTERTHVYCFTVGSTDDSRSVDFRTKVESQQISTTTDESSVTHTKSPEKVEVLSSLGWGWSKLWSL